MPLMSESPEVLVPPLLVSPASFDRLAPEWAALHAAVPGATIFTHPAWHAAWLRHFGAGTAPLFLEFRDGEDLVGVAALDLAGPVARTLGDENVRDYGGPLARPSDEARVAAALLEFLREDRTRELELWGVPGDAPMVAAMRQEAEDQGWSFEATVETTSPFAALPATFDEYVAQLAKKDRHELRRKMRNLDAAGEVRYEVWTGDDAFARIDALFALMRASRQDKDAFLTPPMEAFFRDLVTTFAPLEMAAIGALHLDGHVAALLLTFESDEATLLYNSGYEPDLAPLAVGLVSKAAAIRRAIESGKARFDFLRGDEEYKRRLGGVLRDVLTLRLADEA